MKTSKLHFRRIDLKNSIKIGYDDNVNTQNIILTDDGRCLHRLSNNELNGKRVSSLSFWHDDGWIFDADNNFSERTGINWKIDFSDGTKLTDPEYVDMLDWLKRFVWSLLVTPEFRGVGKSVSSMDGVNVGMRTAVRWMQEFSVFYPYQITESIVSDFSEDLPRLIISKGPITFSQVLLPLSFFEYLWRQSEEMASAGVKPMNESPFPISSPYTLANEISEKGVGWIYPLPDEIAILSINSAQIFIEKYGDEISELIDFSYKNIKFNIYEDDVSNESDKFSIKPTSANAATEYIKNFKYVPELLRSTFDTDNADSQLGIVRQLMLDLVGASIIVILGCTGMRISELASINVIDKSGKKADRIDKTLSGIFEVFYITSALVKGEISPKKFEWLAGMRILGSEEIPPVVMAYRILENIFHYPRKICGVNSLFVSLPPGRGVPRTKKGVGQISGGHLRDWMHRFLERHVKFSQLPDQSRSPLKNNDLLEYKESKGRCIKPTQFRKTFASFSIQVDSKMLPAIAMHFKHVSHAITETGYIGNNPGLLIERDSLALQKTAKLFFDVISGNLDLAGRRGIMLKNELLKLRDNYESESLDKKWSIAEDYAKNIGVYAWFEPDGGCLPLDSSEMRCYTIDGDRPKYGDIHPKLKNRRVSVCSGCKNYFLTTENKERWISRYRENYLFFKQQKYLNNDGKIFEKRALVSENWLRKLNENVDDLKLQVEVEFLKWLDLIK